MNKERALEFFQELHRYLDKVLPSPDVLAPAVEEIVAQAKRSGRDRHMSFPEAAFLNAYLVPRIHEFLARSHGLGADRAKRALLSESYKHMREFASGTPARLQRHPFKKIIAAKPQDVMKQWKGLMKGSPLTQSCPDLAFRWPCEHRTVIEGKYFTNGGAAKAETDLVTNIYQAFFYRSLPCLEETTTHPEWNYDYGCLLAYDASPKGALLSAWNSLPTTVRDGCWDGGNVYVMILRGGSLGETVEPAG